jgi:pSer/pThr/pTyr-binding forkhead associated (FHA) protein
MSNRSTPSFGSLLVLGAQQQTQEFVLTKAHVSIGRAATCDIVLEDQRASRVHAFLDCSSARCILVDNGSANGIKINGLPATRAELASGDRLTIGSTTLVYQRGTPVDDAFDADLTLINSSEQLDQTIADQTVVSYLSETANPNLIVVTSEGTQDFTLERDVLTIGRLAGNDVRLNSPRVSRRHARIERTGSGFLLRDLNSDNGTWVGRQKIETHRLTDNDIIHIGDAQLVFKAGDVEADKNIAEAPPIKGRPRRPVVVIPGFLGSNLYHEEKMIWPNVRELFRIPEMIRYAPGEGLPLTAKGLVDEVVFIPNLIRQQKYGLLTSYLEQELGYEVGKDCWEFGYDFRQDLRTSAAQLALSMEQWSAGGPITIIAHSMGALISRYYVNILGGHRNVERLILLGGPHSGSPRAVLNLGVKGTVMPFGFFGRSIQEMLLSFPSMYHLLPEQPCGTDQNGRAVDWLHDPSWLPDKFHGMLREAASFRQQIGASAPPVSTLCIFGYGLKTESTLRVHRESDGSCTRIEPVFGPAGDGIVPESMAQLSGADIHPVQQFHGTLHTDQDVKKRLKLELTRA